VIRRTFNSAAVHSKNSLIRRCTASLCGSLALTMLALALSTCLPSTSIAQETPAILTVKARPIYRMDAGGELTNPDFDVECSSTRTDQFLEFSFTSVGPPARSVTASSYTRTGSRLVRFSAATFNFSRDEEYTFICKSCTDATGTTCGSDANFTTSARTVWPVRTVPFPVSTPPPTDPTKHYDVLDGRGEVIAWGTASGAYGSGSSVVTGYHDGVDLNGPTNHSGTEAWIVAPRGGFITVQNISATAMSPPGQDDGFVEITVILENASGDRYTETDSFSHVATTHTRTIASGGTGGRLVTQPMLAVGDWVAPGQHIAFVGRDNQFRGKLDEHTHVSIEASDARSSVSIRHLLDMMVDDEDRDPNGSPPAFCDENRDAKYVLFRENRDPIDAQTIGATFGETYEYVSGDYTSAPVVHALPLAGDIDIMAEITDNQGDDPHVAPMRLGYWIEGPKPSDLDDDDVRSFAEPYLLFDFQKFWYGGDPNDQTANPPVYCYVMADISDEANAGCSMLGLASECTSTATTLPTPVARCETNNDITDSSISNTAADSYTGPVLHHFVVTHATTATGDPFDIDMEQFWNTDAKDTGLSSGSTLANYALQSINPDDPDRLGASKASEARFPDGWYKLHFVPSDLVHEPFDIQPPKPDASFGKCDVFTDPDVEFERFRVENFAPIIDELAVYQDADNSDATSHRRVEGSGCELPLYTYQYAGPPNEYPGADALVAARQSAFVLDGGAKLCVRVRFSESMDSSRGTNPAIPLWGAGQIVLDPDDDTLPEIESFQAPQWSETYNPDDTMVEQFRVPRTASGLIDPDFASRIGRLIVAVTAKDLPGRGSQQRGLDNDDTGEEDENFTDRNHLIATDLNSPSSTVSVRLGE
jgi:hypothetical protein